MRSSQAGKEQEQHFKMKKSAIPWGGLSPKRKTIGIGKGQHKEEVKSMEFGIRQIWAQKSSCLSLAVLPIISNFPSLDLSSLIHKNGKKKKKQ